jgi:hypothetical protein
MDRLQTPLGDDSGASDFPVFILGSPRSGTSTLAHVFSEHFGYAGHPEGHVFDLLHRLSALVREHYVIHGIAEKARASSALGSGHKSAGATTTAEAIGEESIQAMLAMGLRDLLRKTYGPSWFDKTPGPEAIHGVSLIRKIYPNARYIFLIREPISNIESRQRKFPGEPFHKHCEAWVDSANAWLRVRADLDPETYLELRTHDLDRDPEGVYGSLLRLLRGHPLGDAAANKPPLTKFLTLERTSATDPAAKRTLSEVGWSAEEKQTFLSICSAVMESFGFTAEEGGSSSGELTLPPPYGQKDVEVTTGEYGGVWPEVRKDGLWIFMHPSSAGTTVTSLTYKGVKLKGVGVIRSRVTVTSERAPSVRFTLRILESGGTNEAASTDVVCAPLSEEAVEFVLPECVGSSDGRFDVSIRTESAEGRVNNAWAMIQPLRLRAVGA